LEGWWLLDEEIDEHDEDEETPLVGLKFGFKLHAIFCC